MDHADYKALWNDRAGTVEAAMAAVDGSRDEATLRLTGAYAAAQVRAALDLGRIDRVFELGCGVARIGRELIAEIGDWHGLDIAENMLVAARQRLAFAGNVRLDALHGPRLAPLTDASVDKGYCVAVFIHLDKEDLVLYLREVARVLRPGGLFYFDHWNLVHPVGWRRFEFELAEAARLAPGQRKEAARNQFCVPEEVAAYVRQAGLELVCLLSDSPWLQVVARKPDGDAAAAAREVARCRADAGRIAYGPDWTGYFDALLDAERDRQPPQRCLDLLRAAESNDSVATMYRAYLQGLWTARVAAWGPPPADLLPETCR